MFASGGCSPAIPTRFWSQVARGNEAAVLKGAVDKQDGQSWSIMRQKKEENVKERENSLVRGYRVPQVLPFTLSSTLGRSRVETTQAEVMCQY